MSRMIDRYELQPTSAPQAVALPQGARVLLVGAEEYPMGLQGRVPLLLWVEVDLRAAEVERVFVVVTTWGTIEDDWDHVGSVQNGQVEWHVYERRTAA